MEMHPFAYENAEQPQNVVVSAFAGTGSRVSFSMDLSWPRAASHRCESTDVSAALSIATFRIPQPYLHCVCILLPLPFSSRIMMGGRPLSNEDSVLQHPVIDTSLPHMTRRRCSGIAMDGVVWCAGEYLVCIQHPAESVANAHNGGSMARSAQGRMRLGFAGTKRERNATRTVAFVMPITVA
jgi:hypothetical protein